MNMSHVEAATAGHEKRQPLPSMVTRALYAMEVGGLKTFVIAPSTWFRAWYAWMWPAEDGPDFQKAYDCHPTLPVRIFFPKSFDQTSPAKLPVLFSIHGGGFCMGEPRDDDDLNRRFADQAHVLVVALNYSKAPFSPFPRPVHDAADILLATFEDPSLPMNRDRVVLLGFSAGGTLALSLSQLHRIRERVRPAGVVSIYPATDLTIPPQEKLRRRRFKPELGQGMRGSTKDYLAGMAPLFNWSYIPYGQDLRDPLLSPFFADKEKLPRHVFIIAAELDMVSDEAWRLARKLAGRPAPLPNEKVGQEKPAKQQGRLILDDERFHFTRVVPGGDDSSLRFLLVPDQVHGFDHLPAAMQSSQVAVQDARLKTLEYQKLVCAWLKDTAWRRPDATAGRTSE